MYEVHPLRTQVHHIDTKFAENGPDLVWQGQTTLLCFGFTGCWSPASKSDKQDIDSAGMVSTSFALWTVVRSPGNVRVGLCTKSGWPCSFAYKDASVGEAGTLEREGLGLDWEGPHWAHWGRCMKSGRARY